MVPVEVREPAVFTTVGLPAARRVGLWESHNAVALIGLHVIAAAPLDATEVNVQLPRVRLARVTGAAHAVERSSTVISQSPAESVAVYLTLRGSATFHTPKGSCELHPGDALICQTDSPFAREFARGLEELVITVPCSAITARADIPPLAGPVATSFAPQPSSGPAAVAGGNPDRYARALARIAGRAARTERPLAADEHTVLDLVAVLAAGRKAAQATAHRAAAHAYIEEHLRDHGLNAEAVASATGISERQLSRIFAADGTSVPRHIQSRRLQLAYTILRAGPGTVPVADVAARCGFTSATYFSHVFRQHFGYRASEIRHEARACAFTSGSR